MKYTVLQLAGKQYIVKEGDTLSVPSIAADENQELEISEVLLTFDDAGENLRIGSPYIEKAKALVKVTEHGKEEKVTVVKFKPKVRYKKKTGHRQKYTKIQIIKIF